MKRLTGKALNASVLDWLLAHPDDIPESWKTDEQGRTRYIYFLGTIYRGGDGLYVRHAYFSDGRWIGRYYWLGDEWGERCWSAVLVSPVPSERPLALGPWTVGKTLKKGQKVKLVNGILVPVEVCKECKREL